MDYAKRFMVEPGGKVRLSKIDPSYTGKHESREEAVPSIAKHLERMEKLQYLLYADGDNPFSWCCKRSTPPARTASCGTSSPP